MYLSRIELDLKRKETQLKLLASPQVVHASVENCFERPNGEPKPRTLWRIDDLYGKKYLMVLSEAQPDFTGFSEQFCAENVVGESRSYQSLLDTLKVGSKYEFKLEANPIRKTQGKKEALYKASEQLEWILRMADKWGFSLSDNTLRMSSTKDSFTRRATDPKVVINKVTFEGLLEVTDPELFKDVLTQGIGSSKAYGCGLLTIVPVGN